MKKLHILVLLGILAQTATAQSSLLWQVSGNGLKKPSYLFGTYHILKDSYLNQNTKVKTAYANAEGVVVEMVVDSSAMLKMAMRALMLTNSLPDLISETDYNLVAKEFEKATGMDLGLFNQVKPVVTSTMLSLAYLEKESDTLKRFTGQPLDMYFATEGKKLGKTVTPLETMEEQITMLYDHDPVEKQARQLVQMVKEKGSMRRVSQSLTDLYLKEDLSAMWKLSEQYGEQYGDMSYLVDERNHNWMKKLPNVMAIRPTFVAVGALHLPGPNGLIELLRKAGFTVEPL
ncbi:TraB/GumN family protein [Nibrella saemangeumensis]|uniref:TraB/GumN family protein n=1 Tax=Nibrella saemangeumensis TaxID=1084526 RepID=A0ABP8MCS3_9BACT